MKQRDARKMFRQLTDLTPRQLQRLKQVMLALKGLRYSQAREVLDIASSLRGIEVR